MNKGNTIPPRPPFEKGGLGGLGGHPLTDEEFRQGKVITIPWKPRAMYAWDSGAAIGRYLEGLKQGRITASRCGKCKRTMVPPRDFCEVCFRAVDDYTGVKDTGKVNTFSVCYVTWDMKRLTDPQIPAVIEIDGASEGMGIMHLLGEVDPKSVAVGMKVKAVWKPAGDRTGAITDIRYFTPLEAPSVVASSDMPQLNHIARKPLTGFKPL